MTEEDNWLSNSNAATLIGITLRFKHVYKRGSRGRRLRLIACAYFRIAWDQIQHDAIRNAVFVAEAFADKKCGVEDLLSAEIAVGDTLPALQCKYRDRCFHLLHRRHEVAVKLIGFENQQMCPVVRDIFGSPFHPVTFDPNWRTSDVVAIAQAMYESRDFSPMTILADALQDAGCEDADILDHCRGAGPHVRGCWIVDLVLGKA